MKTVLAVDIGGTGTRAALQSESGRSEVVRGPGVVVGPSGIDVTASVSAVAALMAGSSPDVVSVGVTGLIGLGSREEIAASLRRRWPDAMLVIASDSVTALAGAFGLTGGVAIAAGTGVVALGTDFRDSWTRTDGWGHLLGDEGGGAWIGLRGLRAALRALDGRPDGSPALLRAAGAAFGEPRDLPRLVYTAASPAAVLAGFAGAVADAARAGDPVAARIWTDAATHLADTAAAALLPGIPERVALVGGLAGAADLLRTAFEARLRLTSREARIVVGESEPLDGAMLLGVEATTAHSSLAEHPPYLFIDTEVIDTEGRPR